MNFLDKLFQGGKKNIRDHKTSESSPYMPDIKLPVDERFIINFKKNGGKFLYCDSTAEALRYFNHIISENTWHGTNILCYNALLRKKFEPIDINYTEVNDNTSYSFLTTCEYLIADTGAILLSSNQIREKKLKDFSDNFIVYATTSQLINTIGEGLKGIKYKYQNKIPSNITTIKNFSIREEKDFLTYGSSSKNLYLLLVEDL